MSFLTSIHAILSFFIKITYAWSVPICPANVPNCPQNLGTPLKKYPGNSEHQFAKKLKKVNLNAFSYLIGTIDTLTYPKAKFVAANPKKLNKQLTREKNI